MTYLQLVRTHPRYLAYGFTHYFYSFIGQTFFISLFVQSITDDLGWKNSLFASIYSAATLASAFLLPQIGKGIDRFRIRYISTAVAVLIIIGCLLLSFSNHWIIFFLGLLAVRMGGQGIMTLIGATSVGRYFTSDRGKALSLSVIGVSAAEILIPGVAFWLIQQYGWRFTWLIIIITLLVVFLPLVWNLVNRHDAFQKATTLRFYPQERERQSKNGFTRAQVLSDPGFWLLLPVVLFVPFFATGLFINQNLLVAAKSWPAGWIAFGFSGFGMAKVLASFTTGGIIDRFSARQVIPFTIIPILIGTLVLNITADHWLGFFFMCLAGLSGGMLTVTGPALWAERYGQLHLGAIKSMVSMFIVLSTAAAPIIFSYFMADQSGLTLLLWGILAIGITCVFLAMISIKQYS